jgi:hypothetical protein
MAAKAVYKVSYIDSRTEDSVTIDGVRFRSKVLRKHFHKVERVFAYEVTMGTRMEDQCLISRALPKEGRVLVGNNPELPHLPTLFVFFRAYTPASGCCLLAGRANPSSDGQ